MRDLLHLQLHATVRAHIPGDRGALLLHVPATSLNGNLKERMGELSQPQQQCRRHLDPDIRKPLPNVQHMAATGLPAAPFTFKYSGYHEPDIRKRLLDVSLKVTWTFKMTPHMVIRHGALPHYSCHSWRPEIRKGRRRE